MILSFKFLNTFNEPLNNFQFISIYILKILKMFIKSQNFIHSTKFIKNMIKLCILSLIHIYTFMKNQTGRVLHVNRF